MLVDWWTGLLLGIAELSWESGASASAGSSDRFGIFHVIDALAGPKVGWSGRCGP